ncbi:hypothetical protein LY76DRAFT_286978 [Colletotrichum caudatum]|nr:hypothetical protein LY76DRAFT_286978 [Colletotrichum caudatum]
MSLSLYPWMPDLMSHSAMINQSMPLALCEKVLFPTSFDSRQLGLCPSPFQRQQPMEKASKRTVGGRGAVTASQFFPFPFPLLLLGLFSALSVSHFCRGDEDECSIERRRRETHSRE